jgi:cystathionine gamma-synthase
MDTTNSRFDTRAIHAGQEFDPTTGAVIPPVYLTSTYVQDGIGGLRNGYEYSRGGNPTRTALETQLAALEGGIRGLSFASGLAAEDALLRTVLAPGDHVVIGNDVYGGTHRLVRKIFGAWGIRHTTVDTSDIDAVRDAIELGTTKVLWVETPSNPLMKISDIAALAELGDEAGVLVVVDNTFASPALQQPITLGTSWCTRPRNTSAATPTSSAAGSCSLPVRRSSPSRLRSPSSRRARSQGRSTRSSLRVASRP